MTSMKYQNLIKLKFRIFSYKWPNTFQPRLKHSNITDIADDIISYIGQNFEAWWPILDRSADPRVQTHSSKGLSGDTSPARCTLWEDHSATWCAPGGCRAGISTFFPAARQNISALVPLALRSPSVPRPHVHAANLVLGPLVHTQFLPLQWPTVLHS